MALGGSVKTARTCTTRKPSMCNTVRIRICVMEEHLNMELTFDVRSCVINMHKHCVEPTRKFIAVLVEPARAGMDDILDVTSGCSDAVWVSNVEFDLVERRNRGKREEHTSQTSLDLGVREFRVVV